MCTHMFMGTKTITIMEDAYNLLKAKKENSESFSDVIRRELSKSKRALTDFAGKWKFLDRKEIELIKNTITESGKYSIEYRKEKLKL